MRAFYTSAGIISLLVLSRGQRSTGIGQDIQSPSARSIAIGAGGRAFAPVEPSTPVAIFAILTALLSVALRNHLLVLWIAWLSTILWRHRNGSTSPLGASSTGAGASDSTRPINNRWPQVLPSCKERSPS